MTFEEWWKIKDYPDCCLLRCKRAFNEGRAELEKENAELKEILNIRSCQSCKHRNKSCPNDGSCNHYSKWEGYKNPQLTKATEIIKNCIHILKHSGTALDWKYAIDQAVQFLKEIEKWHN